MLMAISCEQNFCLVQMVEEERWICTMHPDPDLAFCKAEQEEMHETTRLSECEGFVREEVMQGQQSNVDFFKRLALKHLEPKHLRHVLPWLAKAEHDQDRLLEGIKVSRVSMLNECLHRTLITGD